MKKLKKEVIIIDLPSSIKEVVFKDGMVIKNAEYSGEESLELLRNHLDGLNEEEYKEFVEYSAQAIIAELESTK